jgi:hypothetical protein
MKLAIGYATGFFVTTVFVALLVAGVILGGTGFMAFLLWHLPVDFPFWGTFRLSIAVGEIGRAHV